MSQIVERILNVFDNKKLLAVRDDWGIGVAGDTYVLFPKPCCCGLAALLLDQPVQTNEDDEELDYEAAVVQLFGFHAGYVEGFVAGYDGSEAPRDPTNEYAEGFEDGRCVWTALEKKKRIWITEEVIEKEMAEPDYNNGPQG